MQRNVRCLQLNAVRHATYTTGICFDSTLDDGGGCGGDWNRQRDSHKYCTIFQLADQAHLAAVAQRVVHGAGGALQCHVNKLCSGFSATHTRTHNINTQPELADLLRERARERESLDLV